MVTPVRYPQGVSNAAAWQFFSQMGIENPFYYRRFVDDFDVLPAVTDGWTVTEVSGGTMALSSTLDGGNVVMTTTTTIDSSVSIQAIEPTFIPSAGNKLFFVSRFSTSDVIDSNIVAGLMPITANPFSPPSFGIYITNLSGSNQFALNVISNATSTITPFPALSNTFVANKTIDVGIYVSANSTPGKGPTIYASIGPNLVGYVPQSGNGTVNINNRSPVIKSTAPNIGGLQITPLAPVLGVNTPTGVALTATFDFVGVFKSR
jgi:hypothetical protein